MTERVKKRFVENRVDCNMTQAFQSKVVSRPFYEFSSSEYKKLGVRLLLSKSARRKSLF